MPSALRPATLLLAGLLLVLLLLTAFSLGFAVAVVVLRGAG